MNILIGKNDVGKSTIMDALEIEINLDTVLEWFFYRSLG